jgi:hypothetical protein
MWRVSSGLLTWDTADGPVEPLSTAGWYTRDIAPRVLLSRRHRIAIEVSPSELHRLIKSLENEAIEAIEDGRDDYADFVLLRCAELREAMR